MLGHSAPILCQGNLLLAYIHSILHASLCAPFWLITALKAPALEWQDRVLKWALALTNLSNFLNLYEP